MPVFQLKRVSEHAWDPISAALTGRDAFVRWPQTITASAAAAQAEFWRMKNTGELLANEALAPWLVLMRAVDPSTAVRMFVDNCFDTKQAKAIAKPYTITGMLPNMPRAVVALVQSIEAHKRAYNGELRVEFVQKLRHKLIPKLRDVAALRPALTLTVMDPQDASLFLQACEAALAAKHDEHRSVRNA